MYVVKNDKQKTGFKGKQLTNDNINSYPDRLKKIWLKAGIIKEKSKSNTNNK